MAMAMVCMLLVTRVKESTSPSSSKEIQCVISRTTDGVVNVLRNLLLMGGGRGKCFVIGSVTEKY